MRFLLLLLLLPALPDLQLIVWSDPQTPAGMTAVSVVVNAPSEGSLTLTTAPPLTALPATLDNTLGASCALAGGALACAVPLGATGALTVLIPATTTQIAAASSAARAEWPQRAPVTTWPDVTLLFEPVDGRRMLTLAITNNEAGVGLLFVPHGATFADAAGDGTSGAVCRLLTWLDVLGQPFDHWIACGVRGDGAIKLAFDARVSLIDFTEEVQGEQRRTSWIPQTGTPVVSRTYLPTIGGS